MLIVLFTNYFLTLSDYFIVSDPLPWDGAELYCIQQCNSHLASFHSIDEYHSFYNKASLHQDLIEFIHIEHTIKIWIGLHFQDFSNDTEPYYGYIDGSDFDFATDTSGLKNLAVPGLPILNLALRRINFISSN